MHMLFARGMIEPLIDGRGYIMPVQIGHIHSTTTMCGLFAVWLCIQLLLHSM
jgi:hypothetical protein